MATQASRPRQAALTADKDDFIIPKTPLQCAARGGAFQGLASSDRSAGPPHADLLPDVFHYNGNSIGIADL
jgi:hypothetical protein